MKTLLTIKGHYFDILLKTKPTESSKMVCWAEVKCQDFFRFDFPIISLHNDKVPYGMPCQTEEKDGKKIPITKFADSDGEWYLVGGSKTANIPHKFLTSSKGRYDINRVISRYILANGDLFGITVPAKVEEEQPELNLQK